MNFLCHMLLSGDDDQLLVGNFMGDFVKGVLGDRFPARIRQGVALHRAIDSFAAVNPLFRQSRLRLSPAIGLYRGVLVDLFYDHFLAADWETWSHEPFDHYLRRTRSIIDTHLSAIPDRMQPLLPVIFDELLPSYQNVAGIGSALERMSRRVKRQNPLAGGEEELVRHYDDLRHDFNRFLPQARTFVAEHIGNLGHHSARQAPPT